MNENHLSEQQIGNTEDNCMEFLECIIPINPIPPYERNIQLSFIVYIDIPIGYVPATNDYLTIINLNQTELSVNHLLNTSVCINNRQVQACDVVTLEGSLGFNVAVDGFRPVCPLHSEGLTTYTAFSITSSIPVSKVLAVSFRTANIPIGYNLCITQGNEFMVNQHGNVYYRNRSNVYGDSQNNQNNQNNNQNNSMFMRLLSNGDINRVIMIPYYISVQPYKLMDNQI